MGFGIRPNFDTELDSFIRKIILSCMPSIAIYVGINDNEQNSWVLPLWNLSWLTVCLYASYSTSLKSESVSRSVEFDSAPPRTVAHQAVPPWTPFKLYIM